MNKQEEKEEEEEEEEEEKDNYQRGTCDPIKKRRPARIHRKLVAFIGLCKKKKMKFQNQQQ